MVSWTASLFTGASSAPAGRQRDAAYCRSAAWPHSVKGRRRQLPPCCREPARGFVCGGAALAAREELMKKVLMHRSRDESVSLLRRHQSGADKCLPLHAAVAASATAYMANIAVFWATKRRPQLMRGDTTRSGMAVASTGGWCGVPGISHTRLPTAPHAILFSCIHISEKGTSTSTAEQSLVRVVCMNY